MYLPYKLTYLTPRNVQVLDLHCSPLVLEQPCPSPTGWDDAMMDVWTMPTAAWPDLRHSRHRRQVAPICPSDPAIRWSCPYVSPSGHLMYYMELSYFIYLLKYVYT